MTTSKTATSPAAGRATATRSSVLERRRPLLEQRPLRIREGVELHQRDQLGLIPSPTMATEPHRPAPEELAQDAFVAALEQWPADGVPDRPGVGDSLLRLVFTACHPVLSRSGQLKDHFPGNASVWQPADFDPSDRVRLLALAVATTLYRSWKLGPR